MTQEELIKAVMDKLTPKALTANFEAWIRERDEYLAQMDLTDLEKKAAKGVCYEIKKIYASLLAEGVPMVQAVRVHEAGLALAVKEIQIINRQAEALHKKKE